VITEDVQWFVDPAAPDRLWCALCHSYPGWLWIPVEPTPAALGEVLTDTFPRPALRRVDFTRHERGFVGLCDQVGLPDVYDGGMVAFNGHDLDRYYTGVPFVDGGSWGSAHLDDPIEEDFRPVGPLGMVQERIALRVNQQMLGRVPSMSWRTTHSRSYLSFEIHTRGALCVRLSYRPAPASHQRVLAAAVRTLGLSLPADVPLDLVAALSGFHYRSEADVVAVLDQDDAAVAASLMNGAGADDTIVGRLAGRIAVAAAMWEGDLEKTTPLLRYARHPLAPIRRQVLGIANWYNWRFLLHEVALHSDADPDLQRAAEEMLDAGNHVPDDDNVFGDSFWAYSLFVDEDGNEHDPGYGDGEE
jgi:hypothetical protein